MNEEVTQSASGAAAAQAEVRVKPLSDNAFLAFFQKIWRWGLGVWYGFADKHPKGSKLIQQFAVMFLFSNLVTIFQALIMIFFAICVSGDLGRAVRLARRRAALAGCGRQRPELRDL